MSYSYLYFLLSSFLLISVACNQSDSPKKNANDNYLIEDIVSTPLGEYQVYHNGHQGYSIRIPKGWIYKVKKNTVLVIQSPKQSADDYIESLDVVIVDAGFQQKKDGTVLKNKMDLNSFYNKHISNLGADDFNLIALDEGEKTINGQKIKWASLKPSDNRKDLRIIKHFIANENQVFILTADLKEDTFPRLGPIFNEIAESIRLLPQNG